MIQIVDLFCGAGGMSCGFDLAGFKTVLGIDFNSNAITTFQKNFPNASGLTADLTKIEPKDIINKYLNKNEIVGIIGGPPCQGFSYAGKRFVDDPRNKLFREYYKFVKEIRPIFFVMENVEGMLTFLNGEIKDTIFKLFEELGYFVNVKVLNAANYQVPQNRHRTFFVGTLIKPFQFPLPSNDIVTVGDSIMDLPELKNGEGYHEVVVNDVVVYNHITPKISEINVLRANNLHEGGNHLSLPKELQRAKHYNSAFRRLDRSKPAFTITTHFRDEFVIHPTQNRIISVREAARLQSFPDDFVFLGPRSRNGQYGQVGNAVPLLLAYAIAVALKEQLF